MLQTRAVRLVASANELVDMTAPNSCRIPLAVSQLRLFYFIDGPRFTKSNEQRAIAPLP